MEKKRELTVRAIESGTVIDHIPSDNLFKILSIIEIEKMDTQIFVGNNLDSKKLEKKGIIKIENKFPSISDINKIALLAPNAVINIIKDYKVTEKKTVEVPKNIDGIAKCVNPKCITNHEKVKTRFQVIAENNSINLRCYYCDKITEQKNIVIL